MSCFVQWGVDPFRNFDLKLFFFLFINMKSTTISQVFSYLIFWGISHSCLWHFPVGCSFASSLITFSQRSVVGNEEHTVRSGRCVLEVFSSSMQLRLWNGNVHVQHTCLFSWARLSVASHHGAHSTQQPGYQPLVPHAAVILKGPKRAELAGCSAGSVLLEVREKTQGSRVSAVTDTDFISC